jgi:hypothetical protein
MNMKICPFCGEKYSGSVMPAHLKICPKNPANKPVETVKKDQEPKTKKPE